MITEQSEHRYNTLKEELDLIAEMGISSVKRLNTSLTAIRSALSDIKTFLASTTFADTQDEIHFFKLIKPRIVAEQIYVLESFTAEAEKPRCDKTRINAYYKQELRIVDRFFIRHKFLYQYYREGLTEMDKLLFLRSSPDPEFLYRDAIDRDRDFSSPADSLFARFMAYERLQDFLLSQLESYSDKSEKETKSSEQGLVWTGDSINLVEIAYGIWLAGQLNHGNANISQIFRFLEPTFQVKLGKAHRRWLDISERKRDSYTKFLDRMTELIKQRVDKELEL
ncbi:RteC domain-containing protein [Pedobacter sp. SYSU D00535]|uniref:RteC domain-containing protein n=1 Tax=Pedobacter sp. SYSU D00535 TaxID=2810308 RepID=UPI001A95C0F2|nr:RteC domain-containing protein [Pedobacter sp. SYSU D00535]